MTFFELFQPGLKYLREEKERQKMLVSKPTHGGGAPLGIDLEAGTAKITIRPKASPGIHEAPDGPPDSDHITPDAPSADNANAVAGSHASGDGKDDPAS